MNCAREGCTSAATCAIAFAIYPPKAVMEFHKTDQYLTRMILGLKVCDEHFADLERDGPFKMMPREQVEAIAVFCGRSAKVAVDVDATRILRVALDDPELAVLERQRKPSPAQGVSE